MRYTPEPAIWSRDIGQRMLCVDRCQMTIIWISNIKNVRCKPRLGIIWSMAAMLREVVVVVVVVVGRTQAHANYAASHVDLKKRVPWVSVSIHACGSVCYSCKTVVGFLAPRNY